MRPSLDEYALRLATAAATRSEDPKRRVGAAVLDERGHVLALGYNGPPPGIDLTPRQWTAKDLLVIHAEVNALRHVLPGEAVLLASTYAPCNDCLKIAAAQGIRRVVFGAPHTAWSDNLNMRLAADMFGIDLVRLEEV